jgi:transposase
MTQIRTEKEMFPLVVEWLKSGITQKEFGQRHGFALHIMPYWVARYRKVHGPTQPTPTTSTGFIQLPTPQATVSPMEVALPSGAVIRFSSLIPVSYLQELLSICSR